jgi:ATP-dependent RNA helicase DeaD
VHKQEKKKQRGRTDFTRFHINLGSKNKISVVDLISLINEHTGNNSIEIGKIEILNSFSFFELDRSYEKQLMEAFKDVHRDGIKVKIEISKSKEKPDVPKRFKKKRDRSGKRRSR